VDVAVVVVLIEDVVEVFVDVEAVIEVAAVDVADHPIAIATMIVDEHFMTNRRTKNMALQQKPSTQLKLTIFHRESVGKISKIFSERRVR
jgi:hypothetical protein